jgi:hypothetical protein
MKSLSAIPKSNEKLGFSKTTGLIVFINQADRCTTDGSVGQVLYQFSINRLPTTQSARFGPASRVSDSRVAEMRAIDKSKPSDGFANPSGAKMT